MISCAVRWGKHAYAYARVLLAMDPELPGPRALVCARGKFGFSFDLCGLELLRSGLDNERLLGLELDRELRLLY